MPQKHREQNLRMFWGLFLTALLNKQSFTLSVTTEITGLLQFSMEAFHFQMLGLGLLIFAEQRNSQNWVVILEGF